MLKSLEICAGAGGQALGIEQAGFHHVGLIDVDSDSCETLRANRPDWNVICTDIKTFSGRRYERIDLLSGGVPCPPFSVAGKGQGQHDERDLFPEALRLVRECEPRAVMLENVRGLLASGFERYRAFIEVQLRFLGYEPRWRLLNASDYGVPQLRPRAVLVALRPEDLQWFEWPDPLPSRPPSVGEVLFSEMAGNGWKGVASWAERAQGIAPTLVGGSKRHGGPDLGPTRARQAWLKLGVDGKGLADASPASDFLGNPRLTVRMAALLQGFPSHWRILGGKTSAYRQVGNAFPPPVARAVAGRIALCLTVGKRAKIAQQMRNRLSP